MSAIDFHRSGHAMARVLVQYIADAKRVRRIVLGEWSDAPTIELIAHMRAQFEAPAPPALCFKHRRNKYAADMARANKRFLDAVAKAGRQVVQA